MMAGPSPSLNSPAAPNSPNSVKCPSLSFSSDDEPHVPATVVGRYLHSSDPMVVYIYKHCTAERGMQLPGARHPKICSESIA